MTKSYAILGTGAIGGYCAVKLAEAGFAVHCLLRSDFSHVEKYGLTLITDKRKVTKPIKAYSKIQDMPACDVILITLKTTENNLLKEMLPKIIHANSLVIVLQNGIGMEQEIAAYIDSNRIIGGSCMLKVNKESPGVIRHFGMNSIELAQYYVDSDQEGMTFYIGELAKDFIKAGIQCSPNRHLPTMRWKKLAGNIPISGLAVVLNAYTQELIQNKISFSLICDITKEVINAAEKSGAKLTQDFYQSRLDVLKNLSTLEKNYSSMKEDFNAKRPLELHAIYHNPIMMAKKNKIEMPHTAMLYQQLLYLNEKNLS